MPTSVIAPGIVPPVRRSDARHAKAEAILYDERHATFVIPGARGRTHFFTADGRLVSSVRYGRDALERKRKLGPVARGGAG